MTVKTKIISKYPMCDAWRGDFSNLNLDAPRIAFIGDSNTMGQGAGTGAGGYAGAREKAYGVLLAKKLGWQDGSIFGDQNVSGCVDGYEMFPLYDTRVSIGSFKATTSYSAPYGSMWRSEGVSASNFEFTPNQKFDRVRIYYPKAQHIGGVWTSDAVDILVDNVKIGTISNSDISPSFVYSDFTVPNNSITVAIKNTSGNWAFISGIETWDSTSTKPIFLNLGCAGTTSASISTDYTSTPWIGRLALSVISPDICAINLLINDVLASVPMITTFGNYKTILQTCEDCQKVFISPIPFSTSYSYDGTMDVYASYMRSLCTSQNTAFIDLRSAFGNDYDIANSLGLLSDYNHPNADGYEKIASAMKFLFIKEST